MGIIDFEKTYVESIMENKNTINVKTVCYDGKFL